MKTSYFCFTMVCLLAMIPVVNADPMQELIETLGSEYEALMPPPSGSVGTDYPVRQAALGSLYTARSIGLLYYQNQAMLAGQEALLSRYDQVIEQNRQIIRLLKVISERTLPVDAPLPPQNPDNPVGRYTE
jgi:hypothetical protein